MQQRFRLGSGLPGKLLQDLTPIRIQLATWIERSQRPDGALDLA